MLSPGVNWCVYTELTLKIWASIRRKQMLFSSCVKGPGVELQEKRFTFEIGYLMNQKCQIQLNSVETI